MQYRKFTKDKLNVSLLGFGCMRLPIIDNDSSKIDEEKAALMIKKAIESGVNYVDTAYPYHQGNSEPVVGKILSQHGLRDKVYLATKSPVWLVEKYEDFERLLDEQLERLQTDVIDFYLLHSLGKNRWKTIVELGVFKFIEEAKSKGKIKYIGFSFHDELPLFKEIVDSYDWDFCQIQLNYIDRHYQAGLEGMSYLNEKSISLVIMEPIKGGKLANASDEIFSIWDESPIKRSPAEWALKYLFNFEEISVVLSGMSSMEHVVENVRIADEGLPNSLSDNELALIDRVTEIYNDKIKVQCTSCEYCLPCPQGVEIPSIFSYYNNKYVFGTEKQSKEGYAKLIENKKDSSLCVECGQCEDVCPQHLEIIQELKNAERDLL